MFHTDDMTAPARRLLRRCRSSVSGVQVGVILLVVTMAGVLVIYQHLALKSAARNAAEGRAVMVADEIERTFDTWRTGLLSAAADPVLQKWYRQPEDRRQLRSEVEKGLLILHSVDRELFDEVCLIDVDGREHARQVLGEVTPESDLSPDESVNPFFSPTLHLEDNHVHRNAPYISPDSHRWVISNSTPLFVDEELVGLLHFEANLDRLHVQLTAAHAAGQIIRVVDPDLGLVITDSVSSEPIGSRPLTKISQQVLPAGWEQASVSLLNGPEDDLGWRVDVLVQPDDFWDIGFWLSLCALFILSVAAWTLVGLHSGLRQTEIAED